MLAAICHTITPVVFKRAALTDKRGDPLAHGRHRPRPVHARRPERRRRRPRRLITSKIVPGSSVDPKSATLYRYRAPTGTTGIKSLTLREKKTPLGMYKVTLRTTNAWAPGAANQLPSSTQVTFNVGGHCFRGLATRVH